MRTTYHVHAYMEEHTEPDLQPLTGEAMSRLTSNTADGAKLDIGVNGFWGGRFERTFLDVRVFNPMHLPTERPASPTATGYIKTRRSAFMSSESLKWNTQPSPL